MSTKTIWDAPDWGAKSCAALRICKRIPITSLKIRSFARDYARSRGGRGLAAPGGMKRIFVMAAAAAFVVLQAGAIAVWSVQPPDDLSPADAPELVAEHRA